MFFCTFQQSFVFCEETHQKTNFSQASAPLFLTSIEIYGIHFSSAIHVQCNLLEEEKKFEIVSLRCVTMGNRVPTMSATCDIIDKLINISYVNKT